MKKIKDKKVLPSILKEIKNYRPIVQDYTFQKSISYSQFSTFITCPKKWQLRYRDGNYQSEASINMTFGTAIHETIQKYLTTMYEVSTAEADRMDLEQFFHDKFIETYKKDYESNNNTHFSNPDEIREFHEDGLMILNFLKKRKGEYFSKRGWHLVGCEIPILIHPHERLRNVIFKGFIDLVMYCENTNKFVIYDIKTSTSGWKDYQKKDETKIAQILFYKYYFSKQFKVPIDDIEVEFFILKRKLPENNQFYLKPIQQFVPASGKSKITKSMKMIEDFIEQCFDEQGMKNQQYEAKPSKYGCLYCPFKNNKELCDKGISS